MEKILIIDDSQVTCELLSMFIKKLGYEAKYVLTLQEGLEQVLSEEFDVVFLDVNMPDGNGLDMLPKIKEAVYDPEVIIITSFGNPDGAEIAIKSGAWDYIEKTPSPKKLMLTLTRALEYRKKKKTNKQAFVLKREGIIGNSPKIKTCLDFIAQAANSSANVLITGQTGTGKELFARAIHDNSHRQNNNFVVVDCASLPATLIESVLFGHEKGAVTGAYKSKVGLIMQADKGTLFLDEVGELPLNLQKAFLRVLQEQRFRPVGSKDEIKSDFRLLAATNKDLDEMVSQKFFREDFLFRLRSLSIELPPLKERLEDIKPLAFYYINEICLRYQVDIKGFSSGFLDALTTYEWPGNVREVLN